MAGFVTALGLLAQQLRQPISFAGLAFQCIVILILSFGFFWLPALDQDEQKHLLDLMPVKIRTFVYRLCPNI